MYEAILYNGVDPVRHCRGEFTTVMTWAVAILYLDKYSHCDAVYVRMPYGKAVTIKRSG